MSRLPVFPKALPPCWCPQSLLLDCLFVSLVIILEDDDDDNGNSVYGDDDNGNKMLLMIMVMAMTLMLLVMIMMTMMTMTLMLLMTMTMTLMLMMMMTYQFLPRVLVAGPRLQLGLFLLKINMVFLFLSIFILIIHSMRRFILCALNTNVLCLAFMFIQNHPHFQCISTSWTFIRSRLLQTPLLSCFHSPAILRGR